MIGGVRRKTHCINGEKTHICTQRAELRQARGCVSVLVDRLGIGESTGCIAEGENCNCFGGQGHSHNQEAPGGLRAERAVRECVCEGGKGRRQAGEMDNRASERIVRDRDRETRVSKREYGTRRKGETRDIPDSARQLN